MRSLGPVTLRTNFACSQCKAQKTYLPDCREANQDVCNLCKKNPLSTQQNGNKIEIKEANKTPINPANEGKNQGDDVYCFHVSLFLFGRAGKKGFRPSLRADGDQFVELPTRTFDD